MWVLDKQIVTVSITMSFIGHAGVVSSNRKETWDKKSIYSGKDIMLYTSFIENFPIHALNDLSQSLIDVQILHKSTWDNVCPEVWINDLRQCFQYITLSCPLWHCRSTSYIWTKRIGKCKITRNQYHQISNKSIQIFVTELLLITIEIYIYPYP